MIDRLLDHLITFDPRYRNFSETYMALQVELFKTHKGIHIFEHFLLLLEDLHLPPQTKTIDHIIHIFSQLFSTKNCLVAAIRATGLYCHKCVRTTQRLKERFLCIYRTYETEQAKHITTKTDGPYFVGIDTLFSQSDILNSLFVFRKLTRR
jgi:hypothetical protein